MIFTKGGHNIEFKKDGELFKRTPKRKRYDAGTTCRIPQCIGKNDFEMGNRL